MNEMSEKTVVLFGGSGFLGRHVVRALTKRGVHVRVAARNPVADAMEQVEMLGANIRDPASVANAVTGADAVVNLVGLLFETGAQTFDAIHHQGAKTIAKAASDASIDSFVQVSAIGADLKASAAYASSKALGEEAVRAVLPQAVILRPSLLIGKEDDFFNKFAQMAKFSPFLPAVGGGETLFQPAFVGDVAEVIARAALGELESGTTYELGGPDVKSFSALLKMMMEQTGQSRLLMPLPFFAATLMGKFFEYLPLAKPVLTSDQVELLKSDNVVSRDAIKEERTFEGIGMTPRSIEDVIAEYLPAYRKR